MFWTIWLCGALIVVIEGICAHWDGFLTQAQIAYFYRFHKAYSFMEHGGMWCDMFVLPPIVAIAISNYHLAYMSWQSAGFVGVSVAIMLYFHHSYKTTAAIPEAGRHHGKVTPMGVIHGFYAVITMWILFLFYFCPISPVMRKSDLLKVSAGLMILFVIGVRKFSRKWKWATIDTIQVSIAWIIILIVTAYKYRYAA